MERPEPLRDLDWQPDRAHAFGQAALDLWRDYLTELPDLHVANPRTPAQMRDVIAATPVPNRPIDNDELFVRLRELAFELGTQTAHGGFMAYISGAGTVPGAAASLIASGLNQNLGGWPLGPGATDLETHVLRWFAQKLGLPENTSGAFVAGGATANFIALTVARDTLAGWDVRRDGMTTGQRLAVYVSHDAHETVDRAADLLGLGTSSVRRLATDAQWRIDTAALRDAIADDVRDGIRPLCIVGTAGTTELGAIDPLSELADIAEENGCWFHVDAAYGGPAAMVGRLKPMFRGIERADSITCDPHKWMNTPISSSIVLFRDSARQVGAFTLQPDYAQIDSDLIDDMTMRYQWTPQFTRPFDALPVWVTLLAHGWETYERRIPHDIELARWLHQQVSEHDELEALAVPELSIVCFRYVPADGSHDAGYLDELNEQTLLAVQRNGYVYPSNAVIDGRYAIRACLINFRTEAEHVEQLVDEVVREGRRLHLTMQR